MDLFQIDLLHDQVGGQPSKQEIVKDAYLLKGFALPSQEAILADLQQITSAAPFRYMVTPGGFSMSVAMTNCGALGWVTDRKGYRYTALDPLNEKPWPAMPDSFMQLAQHAAAEAGFSNFVPDACLINQYKVGARMSLHQDKNELDFNQPIVSVSLGLPSSFQFGGFERADKAVKIPLYHGDVVVWGGESRLRYHGVLPLKASHHPATGEHRVNLTFRKAG
ncbi:MAG: DNA oxidative demethylase AlkB [Methylotenera sp.]